MAYFPFILLVFLLGLGTLPGQIPDPADPYYHFSMGQMYEAAKQYPAAISEFTKAVHFDPKNAQLRVAIAESLIRMKEIQRAIEESTKAVEIDPKNSSAHYLLGEIYMNSRRDSPGIMRLRAIAEYRKTIELDPHHHKALFYLGQLQLEEGHYIDSIHTFQKFLAIQPWVSRAYLGLAKAHLRLNEVDEAIRVLEQSLFYGEKDTENIKALGDLYEHIKQHQKAQQLYSQSLDKKPDPEIRFRLARILTERQQFEEAVSILRDLNRGVTDLRIKLVLGKSLKGLKRFAEAKKVLEEILSIDSDNFAATYMLGESLSRMGERRRAIDLFLGILDSKEGNLDRIPIETNLALLYQETRQFDKAIHLLRTITNNNPENDIAKLRLTYVLEEAGRLPEALTITHKLWEKYANRSYQEYPDKKYFTIARAQMLSAAHRLEEAVTLLNPQDPHFSDTEEFCLVTSQLQINHKNYKEAKKIVLKRISQHSDSEKVQFQLGTIYERLGQLELAESVFKKILVLNPTHSGALNYLGYMLANRDLRLIEALDYIRKAVEIEPYNGAYLDSLGWVYFKLNKLDKAEVNLTQAVQLNEGDPTIYSHLGDLYRHLNQYKKAKTCYQKSISFSPEDEELRRIKEKLQDMEKFLSDQNQQ